MSDQEFADLAAGGSPPSRIPASMRRHWRPDGTPKSTPSISELIQQRDDARTGERLALGTVSELLSENQRLRAALQGAYNVATGPLCYVLRSALEGGAK